MDPTIVAEWLKHDSRRVRPADYNEIYPLTVDLIIKKTQCLLPRKVIQNQRVLDLGAGIPYFEIWCNENNAHYTGVEIQRDIAHMAMTLIDSKNNFFHDSIENFINHCNFDNFDVIVLSSTLHLTENYLSVLEKLLSSRKTIIIEETILEWGNGPQLTVWRDKNQFTSDPEKSIKVQKWHSTMDFLEYFMIKYGYTVDKKAHKVAEMVLPEWFKKWKYFLIGRYDNTSSKPITMQDTEWKFNDEVAQIFEDHAIKHIPDYEHIIKQLPSILHNHNITTDKKIIDFGCATGSTLRTLRYNGYKNISGVDSSQTMLDKCPDSIAKLICDDKLPEENYDVIISNWTLHFNENKWNLLTDFKKKINQSGLIILSEKTKDVDRNIYHRWKASNGLTQQEIENKEKSLQGKMFLHTKKEYEEQFKIHNFEYQTINDKFGFVTWVLHVRK